jgi:hypothetical protein
LRDSLFLRDCQVGFEFDRGDSLEDVLNRHLLTVEEMAHGEIITSILLLSADGKILTHGAAPNLPMSYREAIDGSVIGPSVGSCGTAAFLKQPVYVIDIATDPLWADYRHLALPHGLRSCWSTPILNEDGSVLATFAIYHRNTGGPDQNELDAIDMITDRVAQAISFARNGPCAKPVRAAPRLRLVSDHDLPEHSYDPISELMTKVARLDEIVEELARLKPSTAPETQEAMDAVARDTRTLAEVIRRQVRRFQ